jgi:hypothetical protein
MPMIAILSLSLMADETAGAILRSNGNVLVRGNPAPASVALFHDDSIETRGQASARLEATGSSAEIGPETILLFEDNELSLDHGSLSVNTSRGLKVRIGCVTVTPVHDSEWTQFDVVDRDGKITVSALRNDVYIDTESRNPQRAKRPSDSDHLIVHEGEHKSREEKCGAGILQRAATPPFIGPWMDSPWAIGAGIAGIGALTCFALCRSSNPISPSTPR